ncbi:Rieske 2Fe-2S domain-containing protein [Niveispirillum sp. KHB5.9]|uniref:Rieske 2Fe-2S domain-containing protein n=1 Tax=Niveispirillum sp. KHB5.9 TaxID=3400269 RepID=UPI003A871EA7
MLKKEANETLSRVGPGTAMGNLFRRFWLPALLVSEVEKPDCPPVRLKILGEELVAFRDTDGRVGIVRAYCSHRLAPLYFGRNENCGIRCPYHGWKFNVDGECVETPNVPADAPDIRKKVGIRAYPTHEAGGAVWVYMGPKEKQPAFPAFENTLVPAGQNYVARWLQRTNWSQGLEGEIDSSHISWLHKDFDTDNSKKASTGAALADADGAPVIELRETFYGFTYGARRRLGDDFFWRVTQWMAPMFSFIPHAPGDFASAGGRAWVPIDDNHTTVFTFGYRVDRPLNEKELTTYASGALFPPRMNRGTFALPGGYIIDTFLPVASKENDFELSREMQQNVNYSGIWGVHDQDRALAESSMTIGDADPGIVDRSQEHLVGSDRAVVTARRRLLRMAEDLADGIDPPMVTNPDAFRARAISKVCPIESFDTLLATYATEVRLDPQEGLIP